MTLLWPLQGNLNGLEQMSEFGPLMQNYIQVLCQLLSMCAWSVMLTSRHVQQALGPLFATGQKC